MNGGAFEGTVGNVFYLAPDTLKWENMTVGYTDFIRWLFSEKLDLFYKGWRWDGWMEEVSALSCDKGFHFYPPLWSKEGSVQHSSRKAVPIAELWKFNLEFCETYYSVLKYSMLYTLITKK